MPVRLFTRHYSEAACRAEPDALFLFGDNLERRGSGPRSGQAVIRPQANALGIPVKRAPRRDDDAYMTDGDRDDFRAALGQAHDRISTHLRTGGTVYWPADGIGTGLAELDVRAPAIAGDIAYYARGLFERAGDEARVSAIVCGGCSYDDRGAAREALDRLIGDDPLFGDVLVEIIQGGAGGADAIARDWAHDRGHEITTRKPNWRKHGREHAVHHSNVAMADNLAARRDQAGVRTMVVAMPGGRGTASMLEIAVDRDFEIRHTRPASPAPETTPT